MSKPGDFRLGQTMLSPLLHRLPEVLRDFPVAEEKEHEDAYSHAITQLQKKKIYAANCAPNCMVTCNRTVSAVAVHTDSSDQECNFQNMSILKLRREM